MMKQNNDIVITIMKQILKRASNDKKLPLKAEIYSHRLFQAFSEILRGLDKLTFDQCKEIIGKSLREDFSVLE